MTVLITICSDMKVRLLRFIEISYQEVLNLTDRGKTDTFNIALLDHLSESQNFAIFVMAVLVVGGL